MSATATRWTGALFRRLRTTGDPHAGETLVRRFLPLARKLARRYHGGSERLEDLVQVASVGLIKAVQRYDDRRGASFNSYAVPTITGELKRHFRDTAWAVHVPRARSKTVGAIDDGYELVDDRIAVNAAVRSLPAQARRVLHMRFIEDHTQADIAARIGVSQMEVSRILRRTLERLRQAIDRPMR